MMVKCSIAVWHQSAALPQFYAKDTTTIKCFKSNVECTPNVIARLDRAIQYP
jgi:hypothetical protein